MLLIAAGLQSPALGVLSYVRDSEVFGELPDVSPSCGFGFVMALGRCWDMDLAMGQWKFMYIGPHTASPGLACVLKGVRCRPPTASGGEHFSLVQTLTLTSW